MGWNSGGSGFRYSGERNRQPLKKETSISELNLNKTLCSKLYNNGIETVEELLGLSRDEFEHIRNFGEGSYNEVVTKVHAYLSKNGMRRTFPRLRWEYDPLRDPFDPFEELLENLEISTELRDYLYDRGLETIGQIMVLSEYEIFQDDTEASKYSTELIAKIRVALIRNKYEYEDGFPAGSICEFLSKPISTEDNN